VKLAIEREVLLAPLQTVNGAIEKKGLPVLTHVLMVGDGETVTFTGSDLETTLIARASFPHEPFAVTLPAKRFLDVLSAFQKGSIVGVQVEADKATIKSGRSRFQVVPLPAEDYPSFDTLVFDVEQVLPQSVLKSMIDSTEHAMAKQDVRYYLNGLLFEFQPEAFTVVATDGHRLAVQQHSVSCDTDRQVIIPSKAVSELKRLLQDTGDCTLSMGKNHVKVDLNERTFITKLIDGQFPDYQRVIPKTSAFEVRVNREAFLAAVSRVALVVEKNSGIALSLTENLLTLKAKNQQDEAEEQMEIEYLGGLFEIGMNYAYLQDVFRAMDSETVKLGFTNPDNSVLVGGVESDDGTFVIMPMRL
jgi:DNA polymerase-3 subunit beta